MSRVQSPRLLAPAPLPRPTAPAAPAWPRVATAAVRVARAPAAARPAPAAPTPGLWARTREAWRKAWAPSWAGVPQWVHDLWVSSGKVSARFRTAASGSAAGRLAIDALGATTAGVWALVDRLAGLRRLPQPPRATPPGPLAPALPRFPGALPWLATQGNQIVDEAGKPVRLKGLNLSGLEFDREADPAQPGRLDALAAMGGNLMRIPLNQRWALDDPAYVKRLDAIVEDASRRGLYVLFDMHWISDHQAATPDAETMKLWRTLASRYREQPAVLYDLHNEPGMIGWETNARWAEALIGEIRAVHPRSLVMVEGTNKGQRVAGALDRPVRAPNVVYQVHAYGPRQHGPGVGEAQWDRLFGKVAEKYPVFVGELGGEPDEFPALSELFAYLDRKGLGWAAWHCSPGEVFQADGKLAPLGELVAGAMGAGGR